MGKTYKDQREVVRTSKAKSRRRQNSRKQKNYNNKYRGMSYSDLKDTIEDIEDSDEIEME